MHDRSVDPVVAEIFSKSTEIPVDGHCGIRHPESGSTQVSGEVHFQASIGEKIKIKDFNKDILLATLLSANNDEIVVQTEHGTETITYDEIAQASTYFEW